jgi:PAS domain S-box-containing protein
MPRSDPGVLAHSAMLDIKNAAALLAAIVASSTDAILSKTLDGTITSWNAATERLFGYSAIEMVGQSIRRIIPPDRQAEEDMILKRIRAGERLDNYETVRLRKDGRPIHVSVTISPVRDPAGAIIGASKIVRDITERKRSEEQIRTLIKEVNHRAKNMLALVQAIARQTAPPDQGEFLRHFLARIQALSTNQDLLVEGDWRSIGMSELVKTQLAAFHGHSGSRILATGPKLNLSAAAAQAIGMALHELATNAAKYGSLSATEGGVDIRWGLTEGELFVEWVERNGPPVRPPKHSGYGTKVISTMLDLTVGAQTELGYAPSGFSWRFRCPADQALADAEEAQAVVKQC